jgi:hypothetical protein
MKLPSDDKIRKTIKRLSKSVDLQEISVKQLVTMIADKTDCDPDDLYSIKKSFIKKRRAIETKIQQEAKNEGNKERMECAPPLPKRKAARNSQGDLSKLHVKQSPKDKATFEGLQDCKDQTAPTAFATPALATTSTPSHAKVLEVMSGDDQKTLSFHQNKGMYYSQDLEQGRRIPQAAGLSWEDPFFKGESEDLVAVFDHDYSAMFRYRVKLVILTRTLPIFIPFFIGVFAIMAMGASSSPCDASDMYCDEEMSATEITQFLLTMSCVLLGGLVLLLMHLYGHYRLIKSQVYSYHLAIARDGIKPVQDNHLEGRALVAAVHCWDTCLLVTRKDEVVGGGVLVVSIFPNILFVDGLSCPMKTLIIFLFTCCFRFHLIKLLRSRSKTEVKP